ncbi:MAG: ATP-binding protein [Limnothrix sp.]
MNIRPFYISDWFALRPVEPERQATRLPRLLVWCTWGICFTPFFLNLLGVDFGSVATEFDPNNIVDVTSIDALHRKLSGSFTHTILEWSAVCTAVFTVVLAFIHFRLQKDVTTPVIAIALFCAGLMDCFHTLAADRLITAVADNRDLIPFTWAICRLANVSLTLVGVSLFLLLKPPKWQRSIYFILSLGLFFGAVSYGAVYFSATSYVLPQTTFPNALFTRPWDVAPLALFLLGGLIIYPRFNRVYPSIFAHSLIISTIPNTMTQIHMAFGSSALFDNHFNIGHFLKIIAYLVPLSGLVCDYYYTYRRVDRINQSLSATVEDQRKAEAALKASENRLLDRNKELKEAFVSLKEAQTQLIQTEKMSSLGQMVAGIAHEINNPVNFIHGNVIHLQEHMQDLLALLDLYDEEYPEEKEAIATMAEEIDLEFLREDIPKMLNSMNMGSERIREMVLSLRNFSRLDESALKRVDLGNGIDSTLTILNSRIKQGIIIHRDYEALPLVNCYPAQLNQVWMNLLGNALDAMESLAEQDKDYQPELKIWGEVREQNQQPQQVAIAITDNGCGFDEKTQQKIFDPFFTTKPIGKGTGLGLAIAYQIIEKHSGRIELKSIPNQGTTFTVILPIEVIGIT